MGVYHRWFIAGVALSIVLLIGGGTNAVDTGVTGKKLLMKPGKLVLLSKDPGITFTGSDPVGGAASSITFDDGNGPVVVSLPQSNWSQNGSATLVKYRNKDAPGGPSLVKIAKVKDGLLKVTAKGLPFAVPDAATTVDVVLSLDGGTNTYCMTFAGTGDGSKFLVKDAPTGSCAPPPACGDTEYPTCGGTCPVGEVCQATDSVSLIQCTDNGFPPGFSCQCVPETADCMGCEGGSCFGCSDPLTLGRCPEGEVCRTYANLLCLDEFNCDYLGSAMLCEPAPF